VCITLPPLRQRRDEIPGLIEFFLAHYSEHYNRPSPGLASDTRRLFDEYDWPGNVRELENLVKRMVILGTDEPVRRELSETIAGGRQAPGPIPMLESREPHGEDTHRPASPVHAPRGMPGPPDPAPAVPPIGSLKDIARQAAREAERELISRTLLHTRWNRREAAELLGISYKALLYKIKEAELDRAS
jgi:DNA-binding NtrC family response regulator